MKVTWFARNHSQSRLNPSGRPSTACTLIAVVAAEKLSRLPSAQLEIKTLRKLLVSSMKRGNMIFNCTQADSQTLLSIPEAIQAVHEHRRPRELRSIYMLNVMSLENHVEALLCEWRACRHGYRHQEAYIVMVTCNRSVLLVAGTSQLVLLDSHRHQERGAVIVEASAAELSKMCRWYRKILNVTSSNAACAAELSLIAFSP